MSTRTGPQRLVPLQFLDPSEIPPPTQEYHGLLRNYQGLFLVLNGDRRFLEQIPTPETASAPSSFQSLDGVLRDTAWLNKAFPYLMFVPRHNVLKGPLLGPLSVGVSRRTTCVDTRTSRITLAPRIVDQWARIEGFFSHVYVALSRRVRETYPDDWHGEMFASASCFGYSQDYDHEFSLAHAVDRSRDAFLAVIAAAALMVLILDGSPLGPTWRHGLWRETGVVRHLWDAFEDMVRDVAAAPVGAIIDYTAQVGLHELDWLFLFILKHQLRVPLYFFFGANNPDNRFLLLKSAQYIGFYPSDKELKEVRRLPDPRVYSEWVFVRSDSRLWGIFINPAVRSPPPREFPPVEPHSGQREGERWQDFFARREASNKKKYDHETPGQRAAREQRKKNALTAGAPGKRGPRVFLWEDTNSDGFFIRRPMARWSAAQDWDDYSANQRRYDSFHNEWDICADFAPDEEGRVSDDDDDDTYGDAFTHDAADDYSPQHSPFPPQPNPLTPQHTTLANDTRMVDDAPQVEHDESSQYPAFPDLPEGLSPAVVSTIKDISAAAENVEAYYSESAEIASDLTTTLPGGPAPHFTTKKILEDFFGLTECNSPFDAVLGHNDSLAALGFLPSEEPLAPGAEALLCSIRDATSLESVPSVLLDLCRARELRFWQKSGINVQFFRWKDGPKHQPNVFVLEPRGASSERYHILVYSAAVVLYVVRIGLRDWDDLVTQLIAFGAEFHLVLHQLSKRSWTPQRIRCIGLGAREQGYTGTIHDYHSYVAKRTEFFQSPRGLLAASAGGIIGRLARLTIKDLDTEILLFEEINEETSDRQILSSKGGALYHDCLTPEEEDLICGVYPVHLNQLDPTAASGHQTQRLSWWPQPAAFFTSGFHCGWWSPRCEDWFIAQLRKMEEGQGRLLTQNAWKAQMRFHRQAHKLFQRHESLSVAFLNASSERPMSVRRSADDRPINIKRSYMADIRPGIRPPVIRHISVCLIPAHFSPESVLEWGSRILPLPGPVPGLKLELENSRSLKIMPVKSGPV
ncbi:hypothetical protein B0H15DRAFT_800702 [Mycena belliarum]|uniref:Uncharacterized protein n=1 Tax=Mycena belliarum TaxID=1033014 RepID=A0AAD6U453_9AGAR|nr:hypothetical protein B0H15DRAFT_800702 [Mycena belliae]